jgi:thermitase
MKTLFCRILLLALLAGGLAPWARADTFAWDTKKDQVTADVNGWPLPVLLQRVATVTGWQVFVEPGTTAKASAKFKDLPMGDALRALLGNLSFAVVPQTNSPPNLYVFHTSLEAATQLVAINTKPGKGDKAKAIPNELVVTVKPGVDINALAAKFGGKVIGHIPGTNTYLLEFPDDATTQAAQATLTANPDVASVDYNYPMDSIPLPRQVQVNNTSGQPDFTLQAKPLGNGNPVVVAAIDTGFDASQFCDNISSFLLPSINVSGSTPQSSAAPAHGGSMVTTILHSIALNSGGKTSVKVLPVDVYGTNATTSTFDVASGISAAVNAGANIVNLSLGSQSDSPYLDQVIQNASQQGVLFFAAAGNQPVTTPTYPAASPDVVAVTAGSQNGTVASYANYGSFVNVVAPGNSVVCYGGQSWVVQGTSASTAYASGLAASVADSGASATQVKSTVLSALPKPVQ